MIIETPFAGAHPLENDGLDVQHPSGPSRRNLCRKADITPARSRRPAPAPQVPIINVTSQVWAQRLRDAGVNRCDLQTRDWVFQGLATGVVLTGRMHLAFNFPHPAEGEDPCARPSSMRLISQ